METSVLDDSGSDVMQMSEQTASCALALHAWHNKSALFLSHELIGLDVGQITQNKILFSLFLIDNIHL